MLGITVSHTDLVCHHGLGHYCGRTHEALEKRARLVSPRAHVVPQLRLLPQTRLLPQIYPPPPPTLLFLLILRLLLLRQDTLLLAVLFDHRRPGMILSTQHGHHCVGKVCIHSLIVGIRLFRVLL